MDADLRDRFSGLWTRFFPGVELPVGFFYTDDPELGQPPPIPTGHRCLIADLARARRGHSLRFDPTVLGCSGGRRYLGFGGELMPGFEYFLSCGITGKLEGERYKKTPELVKEHLKHQPPFTAPGRYIVFRRWDRLTADDAPVAMIFFAPPDVLAGLFTLANYDETEPNGVIAPFGAGCASIVDYPHREAQSSRPRAVLGMFDVSARPCVGAGELTFTVPWPKFVRMVDNMPDSFLITPSWAKVRNRLRRAKGKS
ncbi:MAG TPA: DUF169 domain-containing protein [Acidobacteriota bacterium]|nr:DUF169 domain-containing protein [Acidobacteriota bacterium]